MAYQVESDGWLDPMSPSPVLDSIGTHQVHEGQGQHGLDEMVPASHQFEDNLQRVDRVSIGDRTSMLQSATDFDIHGGSFSTVAGDNYTANRDLHLTIHNHIHTSARNEGREATDDGQVYEMTQPPPLPVQRSCDIYRRHMASKGRGIPLWIPEANKNLPLQYQRQGITIGDVGVMTASGGFAFLFNICLAHDHPINPPTLPVDFKTIHVAAVNIHCHSEFKNNSYLASASTVRSQNDGDTSGLVFESSASDGAILTMPLGSKSEDLGSVGRFRKYVAANMLHWYKYAYHDREYDVRNGDLRLVIGYDKTSSWGMATFANSTAHQESFHLKFGLLQGRRYGWEYSGTAEVRAGPDVHEIEQLRDDDPSQHNITYENQCLFVRTINATLPDDIWDSLGFDHDELDLIVESHLPDAPSTLASSGATLKSNHTSIGLPEAISFTKNGAKYGNLGANDNLLTIHGTRTIYSSSTFLNDHPSKVINAMLLKNSSKEVKMAITQDQDWMSVMTEEDATMPTSEDLIARIRESFDICEQDGVVYLTNAKGQSAIVHDDTVTPTTDFLPEAEGPFKDLAQVDTFALNVLGTPIGDRPDSLQDVRNVISPEDVPSFYNSVTILKSTYRNIERLKIYREKCKIISDKCFELMKALVDGSQGIESAVISDVVEEVEGIVSQFERSLGEWASWNRLRSILKQREIRDRIYQLHRDMEGAVSRFHIQVNLDMTRNVGDAQAIQQREKSEIRNVLRSIVKSSEEITNLLRMQSLPGSHAVEEIMERLQTELMDPMLQPNESEDYKSGLWLLHEKTSKLPPLIDLTGQIKWSPVLSTKGMASSIFHGQWLDREDVLLRRCVMPAKNFESQRDFEKEITSWRALDHPNIVPVYGITYLDAVLYIVNPWMDNGPATRYIKNFPEANRLRLLTEVAYGLEYLHDQGVIHGDLRGKNVLISTDGNARVAHFGQSKFLEHFDGNALPSDFSNPRWMAPEMLQGAGSASTHSDVWSYGMLCLEILSDEHPYSDIHHNIAVIREIESGNLPKRPETATANGLSDGMWTLLRKCWQQKPESRPSISDVRAQLIELQGFHVSKDLNLPPSMLKERQKGKESQVRSTTSSRHSSTSNLHIFSEEKPTTGFSYSRNGSVNTNATPLPSSSIPIRPLLSDDRFLTHYSSDSISESINQALLDPRIVVEVVEGDVRRGTLEGLVQHLIGTYDYNSQQDIEYRYLLLVACPDFTTPEYLFTILSRRFHEVESSVAIRAEDKVALQYNVFSVIMYWLSERDLKVEPELLRRIRYFCEDAARVKASATMVSRARDLLEVVEHREALLHRMDPAVLAQRKEAKQHITPVELAIALTLLEGDTYKVLTPVDYLGHLRRHPGINNVEGVYTTNNMIILWVKDSILRYNTTTDRARALKFFVNTAAECRKLRNFSSLVAIATALHSSPIEKLLLTKLELSMQMQSKLASLKDILDVSANHRSYREALEDGMGISRKGPCIPWLAIHLKELHAVLQRYPIVVQVAGKPLINFERYVKFMDRVKEAVHYMPPDLEQYRQQGLLEYIEDELAKTKLANITEEDLVARSKNHEAQEMMMRHSRKSQLRSLGFLKKK